MLSSRMELSTADSGWALSNTATASKFGLMELAMKETGVRTKLAAKVNSGT